MSDTLFIDIAGADQDGAMVAHQHTATGMRFTLNGELARFLKNLVDDLKTARARANARAEAAEAQSARLREALRACVEAHESGRYEPAHAAYNAARAALGDDA